MKFILETFDYKSNERWVFIRHRGVYMFALKNSNLNPNNCLVGLDWVSIHEFHLVCDGLGM